MTEQQLASNISQDPSQQAGNLLPSKEIDLFDTEVTTLLHQNGELFRRKIQSIAGVREPVTEEIIETIVNGILESKNTAHPGVDKIITGSRGEEFVLSKEKFDSLYSTDEDGTVTPRERLVLAMKNPYSRPIRIEAPWSTPDNYQTQDGTSEAMLTFGLDEAGELTSDRYIIGDLEMLLANYEPVITSEEK